MIPPGNYVPQIRLIEATVYASLRQRGWAFWPDEALRRTVTVEKVRCALYTSSQNNSGNPYGTVGPCQKETVVGQALVGGYDSAHAAIPPRHTTYDIPHTKQTAEGGSRTHTPLRARDFESRASASSATSAILPRLFTIPNRLSTSYLVGTPSLPEIPPPAVVVQRHFRQDSRTLVARQWQQWK